MTDLRSTTYSPHQARILSPSHPLTPPKDMVAAVLYGREDVRVERIPVPDVEEGEVRVRIGAALTCGTDVKVYRRGYHARMLHPPTPFGHEFAGIIEEVGHGVTKWQVGQRVVAANSAPCGECFYCRRQLTELCEDLLFLNGAYAERITVPARIVEKNLYAIPDHLSFEEAALTEPLACVVRGMEEVPIRSGETVVVIGVGPIGLMFIRLCHQAGARVLAAGKWAGRLALALRFGAAEVFDVAEGPDIVHRLRARTEGGRGADKVIEAVGLPEAWEQAIAIGRKGATVSLFGGCPADSVVRLDTHRVHYDEVRLAGTFHHRPHNVQDALNLIASDRVPAREFIQRREPLRVLPGILADLAAGSGVIKTAILPSAQE